MPVSVDDEIVWCQVLDASSATGRRPSQQAVPRPSIFHQVVTSAFGEKLLRRGKSVTVGAVKAAPYLKEP